MRVRLAQNNFSLKKDHVLVPGSYVKEKSDGPGLTASVASPGRQKCNIYDMSKERMNLQYNL